MTAGARNNGGIALYWMGWAAFAFSVLFIVMKWLVPARWSLGVLLLGSLVCGVGVSVSQKWRSQTVQSYFSPYLLGSAGWLLLFLSVWLFNLLNR